MKFAALKVLAIGGAMLTASAASATNFTFNLTNKGNLSASAYNDLTFTSTTDGTKLTMNVYGAHMNDTLVSGTSRNSVSAATVAAWQNYGLGVLFGSDSTSNETHQIDNAGGGVDFVVLSFDQAVTLSGYNLTAYRLGNNSYIDNDSSFMAYNGDLADLLGGVNKSAFTTISDKGSVDTQSSVTSSVWLVGAAVANADRRADGFKLTSLSVDTVSAVPEPATWAMMLVGFGAIGGTLRSRRGRQNMAVTFG